MALRMHEPKISARKNIKRAPTKGRNQEVQFRFCGQVPQDSESCHEFCGPII